MKKYLFLFAALVMGAAMLAPQGLSAQKRVVKVQGHPHELLTRKAAEGKLKRLHLKPPKALRGTIDPDNILCWANIANLITTPPAVVDTAYLLIKFTDGKISPTGVDSLIVWGFRYNSIDSYGDTTGIHTIDMLRTVANLDKRLTVMLQYTGVYGYSVVGIGYNHNKDCSRVPVFFDYKGAVSDTTIAFHYIGTPNCNVGQVAVPPIPQTLAQLAIEIGDSTGIIDHPFNAFYGYPAYDYDYWKLDMNDPTPALHSWQAGWKNAYWGYFIGVNRQVPTTSNYAQLGIAYQVLNNQEVHGFVFESPADYPPVHDFSGNLYYEDCTICRTCQLLKR
ncbi:MAG: hypothetical protein LBF08_03610 [Dysgonamonadaceae bacterium]|jgi:hypothetical protein|nr:hypothetical protein [Dysgonamonadaceae bacterium]